MLCLCLLFLFLTNDKDIDSCQVNPTRTLGVVNSRLKAVAIDCEMVGGGDDGSIDLCASICLVDEDEHVIFSTHVQPQLPVTDYRLVLLPPCLVHNNCSDNHTHLLYLSIFFRHKVTGLTEEDLKNNGMRLQDVREKVLTILCGGHNDGVGRLLLVGHDLRHDMKCLKLQYPSHLLRWNSRFFLSLKSLFFFFFTTNSIYISSETQQNTCH